MSQYYIYKCKQIISCTPDISIFLLQPQDQPLIFQPGQYVEAWLDEKIKLPLSIANLPQDGYLEFHLRHDENHPLAQQLIQRIRREKKLYLEGPKGHMILARVKQAKQLLFLAGGTGFAPLKSLLRAALINSTLTIPLKLYWGVRRPAEAFDEPLLKQWLATFPQFHYEIVLSEPEYFPQWEKARGLVPHYLAQQHANLADSIIFASGPFPMIQAAKKLFHGQGLALDALISDLITPP